MLLPVSCFLYETRATMIAIGPLSNHMAFSILLSLSPWLPCALFLPASPLSREFGIPMFFPKDACADWSSSPYQQSPQQSAPYNEGPPGLQGGGLGHMLSPRHNGPFNGGSGGGNDMQDNTFMQQLP
jgi:hypothetical protein